MFPHTLPIVTEATFSEVVLAAPASIIVCFIDVTCLASATQLQLLSDLATSFEGILHVVQVDARVNDTLVELYDITAVPSLLVFRAGEVITRANGFVPKGLLHHLYIEAAHDRLPDEWFWRPTEDVFETTVILPLIEQWGWNALRQVSCSRQSEQRRSRGRVDILVFDTDPAYPITLFENKRLIACDRDLHSAKDQAFDYARAFALQSFVVAAPSGLWVYRCVNNQARLAATFSSLHVQTQPMCARDCLEQFR